MTTKTAPIKNRQSKKSKSQRTSTKQSGKGSKKTIATKHTNDSTLNSQNAKKIRSQQSTGSKARGKASAKKGKSKRKHVKEKVRYNSAGNIIDFSINVDEYEIESSRGEESETSVLSEVESIEISGDLTGVEVTHTEDSWTDSATDSQGADQVEDDDDNGTIWGGPQITGESSEGSDHD